MERSVYSRILIVPCLLLGWAQAFPQSTVSELCKSTFEGAESTVVYKRPFKSMSLSGRILSEWDTPVEDVEIGATDKTYKSVLARTRTDAKGFFTLQFHSGTTNYLVACKPGFSPVLFRVRLEKRKYDLKPFSIILNAN